MVFSKELIVLKRDLLKRKQFLKSELKKIIFKSIFQNYASNTLVRIEVLRKLIYFKKKTSITRQNNVCLITGRVGGVYKRYNFSRHEIKRFGKLNMLNNTKIISF